MSSTPLDLPVLISQMPHVAKIAQAEKAAPEVKQQLFGPVITEQIREAEGKVAQVNKKEKTDPIDRDGKRREQQAAPTDRKEKKKKEPDDDPSTGSSTQSPWAGNIVNVKI